MQGCVIVCLYVIAFFVIVATRPAGLEFRARQRELRDRPLARGDLFTVGVVQTAGVLSGSGSVRDLYQSLYFTGLTVDFFAGPLFNFSQ